MQVLLLAAGAECFAIALGRAREVLPEPAVTPLPMAPPAVRGVTNVRGEVVPVLDPAVLLGLATTRLEAVTLVDTIEGPVGLVSSELPTTARLRGDGAPAELSAASATYAVGSKIVALLDLDDLLSADRVRGSWKS